MSATIRINKSFSDGRLGEKFDEQNLPGTLAENAEYEISTDLLYDMLRYGADLDILRRDDLTADEVTSIICGVIYKHVPGLGKHSRDEYRSEIFEVVKSLQLLMKGKNNG